MERAFITVLPVVAVVPAVAARHLQTMLPWEILLVAALPVVGSTFSMPTAAVWAVSRWISDRYLGTQFLLVPNVSNEAVENRLMWEFIHSTLTGIGTGVLYELGFRRRTAGIEYRLDTDL